LAQAYHTPPRAAAVMQIKRRCALARSETGG